MLADDESHPFSFVSICHALGLDVGYVRHRVLHLASESRGPARRYAAKACESWLRLAAAYSSSVQARLAKVRHPERRDAASQLRCSG
jgi:hypothetical protein